MPYDFRALETSGKKFARGMRKFVETERRVRKIHVILGIVLIVAFAITLIRIG